jgi:peptide/nickel transport system permease protein
VEAAVLRNVLASRSARIAVGVLLVVVIIGVFATELSPDNPNAQSGSILAGPSWHHLLGTDNLGRDTLSRILLGTRYSLIGALEAVAIGFVGGVIPGMASVFAPRWLDFSTMRVVDALMTIPSIVFALGFVAALGESQAVAMCAIGILLIPHFFRITRAATLRFTRIQYVEAARSMGATRQQIIRTHIWPKIRPTVAVTTASTMAAAMLAVASLSFLGIGLQAPAPTLGGMLSADLNYLPDVGWLVIFPGLVVVATVASLGVIADSLHHSGRIGTGRGQALRPSPAAVVDSPPTEDRNAA